MDLKGSTSAAEQLGHARYSELLQECYRDLTSVVLRHQAAIYQYVGDEVVMSWPYTVSKNEAPAVGEQADAVQADAVRADGAPADKARAAVLTFFAYEAALRAHAKAYQRRFGMTPTFRGGIAVGSVTVIEVGDVKREIVYHGDVLNTAARLLEICTSWDHSLLVSDSVGEAVKHDARLQVGWHGEVSIRGKREPVEAYSLLAAGNGEGW